MKKLIINKGLTETRIALLDAGKLAELYIERRREPSLVGNVYRGKVSRVLPGMQSAFVEIGADRTAFLYGGDVFDTDYLARRKAANQDFDFDEVRADIPKTPIEKLIKEGQDIVVQVTKDPLGTKGARLSMYLTLPGRYLVLMPEVDHVGISRRIEDESLRIELRSFIEEIRTSGVGVIVRTAALAGEKDDLEKDMKYLQKVWKTLQTVQSKKSAPALLYQEPDIVTKVTRDIYSDDISDIVVDDPKTHVDLIAFLKTFAPAASKRVQLYGGLNPLFDEYDIEVEIGRALNRKVWLPSGGYLIIDQTEALTSFDVNTGKFVGKLSVHETILKTNLEAVDQIVVQLKLRNIGGIIVIDFIDMECEDHRTLVFSKFEEALKQDKARTNVLKISELGLVQMTRKRTSESLEKILTEACPTCDGRGHVRSTQTEAYELLREIARHCLRTGDIAITIHVRADVKKWLEEVEPKLLESISSQHQVKIALQESFARPQHLHQPAYEIKE